MSHRLEVGLPLTGLKMAVVIQVHLHSGIIIYSGIINFTQDTVNETLFFLCGHACCLISVGRRREEK